MRIDSLHIYPIKSIAGVTRDSVTVQKRGFEHDRRYVLVDAEHRFLTGRQVPDLVLINATQDDDAWTLDAPGQQSLRIASPPDETEEHTITVWRDEVAAKPVGAEADAWFSDYLGAPCHLMYQHAGGHRPVAPTDRTEQGDEVSFADGYPVLLIGTASLVDLNSRLASPVAMTRFRTNIVADTATPFVEDQWQRIRIGDVTFDVAKRCARCVFTTIDPLSGQKDPAGEPLATLRGYRLDRDARGVMFGVNLVARNNGRIGVSQPIEVLA